MHIYCSAALTSAGLIPTTSPQSFVGTCFRLEALEAEHTSKLAALRSEFLQDAAGETSAGSVNAALDITGGWSSDQHFRFDINLKTMRITVNHSPKWRSW